MSKNPAQSGRWSLLSPFHKPTAVTAWFVWIYVRRSYESTDMSINIWKNLYFLQFMNNCRCIFPSGEHNSSVWGFLWRRTIVVVVYNTCILLSIVNILLQYSGFIIIFLALSVLRFRWCIYLWGNYGQRIHCFVKNYCSNTR